MKAMYAGSFNPFHIGHYEVYKQALKVFDKVILAIPQNIKKQEIDFEFIKWCLAPVTDNVVKVDGLVWDAAKENDCKVLIRGIRDYNDFTKETKMAEWNKSLGEIDTWFVNSSPELSKISSSAIKELNHYDKEIAHYFPNLYSYHRWIRGQKPKNSLFFGKISVGKSKVCEYYNAIDLDKEIWRFFSDHTKNKYKNKIIEAINKNYKLEYERLLMDMNFAINWNGLLIGNNNYEVSALGRWFEFIPESVLSRFNLVKIDASTEDREKFIEARGLSKQQVEAFDNFYIDPPFYDELIINEYKE